MTNAAEWILVAMASPIFAKITFDWIKNRRNGNAKKIIICPLDKKEVIEDIHNIAEALDAKDGQGIPLRYTAPLWGDKLDRIVETLKEISEAMKSSNGNGFR